jgi:hypothetical protein
VQKQPPTTPAADDGKLQQEEDSPEMAGATPRERHILWVSAVALSTSFYHTDTYIWDKVTGISNFAKIAV